MAKMGVKSTNKSSIASYVLEKRDTTKAEISAELGLSMPTILSNVKDLMEEGIIIIIGENESTGGRKAKALSVNPEIRYSCGIDITAHHVSYVMINVFGTIIDKTIVKRDFANSNAYYDSLSEDFEAFLAKTGIDETKLLGIGFSIPGIVDAKQKRLIRSNVLNLNDFSLKTISKRFRFDCSFENDANSAAYTESIQNHLNVVFLALKNNVGGSFHIRHDQYYGNNFRAGEFGHITLVPGGRQCHCGKQGCVDTYLSKKALTQSTDGDIELFFEKLAAKDAETMKIWEEYTDLLAIFVVNLRLGYDCDVIIGGDVGTFIDQHMDEITDKILMYDKYDNDALYVRTSRYKREASAVGIALTFVERFFHTLH